MSENLIKTSNFVSISPKNQFKTFPSGGINMKLSSSRKVFWPTPSLVTEKETYPSNLSIDKHKKRTLHSTSSSPLLWPHIFQVKISNYQNNRLQMHYPSRQHVIIIFFFWASCVINQPQKYPCALLM